MGKNKLSYALSQIIPSLKCEIETAMTKKTILKTVESHSGSYCSGAAFGSKVSENGFNVFPNTSGVNRLAPSIIEATVTEENGKTRIKYHAHILPFYRVTSILILCLFSLCFLLSLAFSIVNSSAAELYSALLFLLFILLTEAIIQISFRMAVKKALKALDDLLIL